VNDFEQSYEHNSYYSIDWVDTGRKQYKASSDSIGMWMKDHVAFNKEMRDLSDTLYNICGVYSRVIDFISSMPTLDKIVYGQNNHRNFKRNKEKYIDALSKIKDKTLTRDILMKLAKYGTYFGYFVSEELQPVKGSYSDYEIERIAEINSKFNCGVISLPIDYCKIIGTQDSSYVAAFDLSYFDQFLSNGLSYKLRSYPKEIRDGFKKYTTSRSNKWLVLDNNKSIVLKVRAEISEQWGRPLGLGAFVDIAFDQDYISAKRNTLQEANGSLVFQTYPEGTKEGKSVLSQTQQKDQHDHVRNALFNRRHNNGTSFISIAPGTKLEQLKIDLDILTKIKDEELIRRIASNLGFASSLLTGEGSNFSSQENNLNLISSEIFKWLEQVESEYNKVINQNIIRDEKCEILLDYLPITFFNRDKMKNNAKDLYTQGKGSLKAWIITSGFNADSYISLMEEELEEDFEGRFPVHQTAFTKSSNDNKPSEDNPTNENTIKTKSNNANNNPSPKGGGK
jgi:hypothetical protein